MIKIQNLSKNFGKNIVLKDITLNIKRGEIFGLIGKNGVGKTTLLSIIAGLSTPTKGLCYLNGTPNEKKSHSVKIGYLPDVPNFFDFMTVGEFIDFLYKKEEGYKEKREKLLKQVGLNGKTIIKTMSRGMKQRLGMAASLVGDPDIVLLDEPTSALDPMGRYELSELLLNLKKQGKTIILSTHILTDMEKICDRVGFLHQGSIVKIVSPNNIDSVQKVKIVFKKPIKKEIFSEMSCDVTFENDKCIILSGKMKNLEEQIELLKKIILIESPIISVNTEGVDLETIFREVCP